LVGLREAVAAAERHITCAGGLSAQLEEAFAFATSKVHSGRAQGLTIEQVAAINLYTQVSPFYKGLNGALGGWGAGGGRAAIRHYLLYIKIAMGALAALPQIETIVYRGIRGVALETLLEGKGIGDALAWWAFTSTTGTSDVLRDPEFFGLGAQHGERVVFVLQIKSGVRVKSFSALGSILEYYMQPFGAKDQNEDEFMLKPGTMFVIDGIEHYTNGVTEVKMHEVPNPAMIALVVDGGTAPSPDPVPSNTGGAGGAGYMPVSATEPPPHQGGAGYMPVSATEPPPHQGGTGYMPVSATEPPPHQGQLVPFVQNMSTASTDGNASSEEDSDDQFEGVDRNSSSTGLLGESML
jgi:hypothetical protein